MSKARILIVHPEPSALALLSSMLKSLGHEIDEAANDRVAVRLMERGGVDLMLAGVDPADAEALELLAYMRRKHRQVPVILLFSSPNPERTKEALRLGALAVLKYPVPATELRAAVTQALGTRRPASQPARVARPRRPATALRTGPPHGPRRSRHRPRRAIATRATARRPPPLRRPSSWRASWGSSGNDPSLRQAIELAGDDRPDADPGPDRRRARDRQVAAGPDDPHPRLAPRPAVRRRSTARPWPRRWPSTSGTATATATARPTPRLDWPNKLAPGAGRHALPRRGRRRSPTTSSSSCSAPSRTASSSTRRPPRHARRRPVPDVHQREPAGPGRAGQVPPGPLPPDQRRSA